MWKITFGENKNVLNTETNFVEWKTTTLSICDGIKKLYPVCFITEKWEMKEQLVSFHIQCHHCECKKCNSSRGTKKWRRVDDEIDMHKISSTIGQKMILNCLVKNSFLYFHNVLALNLNESRDYFVQNANIFNWVDARPMDNEHCVHCRMFEMSALRKIRSHTYQTWWNVLLKTNESSSCLLVKINYGSNAIKI